MTQTLRQISAAPVATRLERASCALLLIDFQNEYFSGRLPIPDGASALANAARLMRHADAHGMPVFHIVHVGAAGGALFADGSAMAQSHPELSAAPQHQLLCKNTTSSFASTDLHAQLQARSIKTLLVAGLMTHNCVASVAHDARTFGAASYQVIVAADACATRAIARWDGGVSDHRTLHEQTLVGLADNLAQVMRSADILALPVEA